MNQPLFDSSPFELPGDLKGISPKAKITVFKELVKDPADSQTYPIYQGKSDPQLGIHVYQSKDNKHIYELSQDHSGHTYVKQYLNDNFLEGSIKPKILGEVKGEMSWNETQKLSQEAKGAIPFINPSIEGNFSIDKFASREVMVSNEDGSALAKEYEIDINKFHGGFGLENANPLVDESKHVVPKFAVGHELISGSYKVSYLEEPKISINSSNLDQVSFHQGEYGLEASAGIGAKVELEKPSDFLEYKEHFKFNAGVGMSPIVGFTLSDSNYIDSLPEVDKRILQNEAIYRELNGESRAELEQAMFLTDPMTPFVKNNSYEVPPLSDEQKDQLESKLAENQEFLNTQYKNFDYRPLDIYEQGYRQEGVEIEYAKTDYVANEELTPENPGEPGLSEATIFKGFPNDYHNDLEETEDSASIHDSTSIVNGQMLENSLSGTAGTAGTAEQYIPENLNTSASDIDPQAGADLPQINTEDTDEEEALLTDPAAIGEDPVALQPAYDPLDDTGDTGNNEDDDLLLNIWETNSGDTDAYPADEAIPEETYIEESAPNDIEENPKEIFQSDSIVNSSDELPDDVLMQGSDANIESNVENGLGILEDVEPTDIGALADETDIEDSSEQNSQMMNSNGSSLETDNGFHSEVSNENFSTIGTENLLSIPDVTFNPYDKDTSITNNFHTVITIPLNEESGQAHLSSYLNAGQHPFDSSNDNFSALSNIAGFVAAQENFNLEETDNSVKDGFNPGIAPVVKEEVSELIEGDEYLDSPSEFDGTGPENAYDGTGPATPYDGTGSLGEWDGTGPESTFDGTGPSGEFDGTGPSGEFDGTGPESTYDGTGSLGEWDGTGPETTYDGTGPLGEWDGTGPASTYDGSGGATDSENTFSSAEQDTFSTDSSMPIEDDAITPLDDLSALDFNDADEDFTAEPDYDLELTPKESYDAVEPMESSLSEDYAYQSDATGTYVEEYDYSESVTGGGDYEYTESYEGTVDSFDSTSSDLGDYSSDGFADSGSDYSESYGDTDSAL